MNAISRITVGYSEEEDRIELACEYDTGEIQVLWLTRRLCSRLVAVLVSRMEEADARDPFSKKALQSWEFHEARAGLVPGSPVEGGDLPGALVNAVDISQEGENVRLAFRWEAGAVLNLDGTALRQWLGIVRDAYVKAEWTDAIWPDWFDASPVAHEAPAGFSLH